MLVVYGLQQTSDLWVGFMLVVYGLQQTSDLWVVSEVVKVMHASRDT